ncbi:hypothetical protein EJB05_52415, partial [Eragrostis curvula]
MHPTAKLSFRTPRHATPRHAPARRRRRARVEMDDELKAKCARVENMTLPQDDPNSYLPFLPPLW